MEQAVATQTVEKIEKVKKEKKKAGPKSGVKWETNRTQNPEKSWEAVLFKDIK